MDGSVMPSYSIHISLFNVIGIAIVSLVCSNRSFHVRNEIREARKKEKKMKEIINFESRYDVLDL